MAGFVSEERLTYGPWQAIERMIARLMEHSGFTNVSLVGGAGDKGADIVGVKTGKRWVFQSKYRNNGVMDISAAKEAVNALTEYKADIAVAVASTGFSNEANQYCKTSKANGIDLRLWNRSTLIKYFDKLPDGSRAIRVLRDYQKLAVNKVEGRRSRGDSRALVVMATGLGKSLVATQLIVNELGRNDSQEVLVLAHTRDLVRQLEISSWPQLEKSVSTHLWTDGEVPAYSGGVVFATWQSLAEALKRGEPLAQRFGLIVVDEAHHAPAHTYRNLLDALEPNFLVGLTATPWRGDELSLEDLFGDPAFTMDIVDGMQKGYLADVDYRMLTDGIDWEEIAIKSKQGLTIRELNTLLLMPDRDVAIVEIVAARMRELESPRALTFCRSIEHAERLRPLFSSAGIRTALLHSRLTRQERFRNLAAFRTGNIDMLMSIEMLNEGIDVPDVNLVAFLRVTHSRRIFVQQLGRGLRISPTKKKVIVLDFVADIRRIASAITMNRDASARGLEREVVRYRDGRIICFENDKPAKFFDEYLEDVADIENYEDGSRLRYPDTYQ